MNNPPPLPAFTPVNAQPLREMDAQNIAAMRPAGSQNDMTSPLTSTAQITPRSAAPSPPMPQMKKKAASAPLTYDRLLEKLSDLQTGLHQKYPGPEHTDRRNELFPFISQISKACMNSIARGVGHGIPSPAELKKQLAEGVKAIDEKWDEILEPIDTTQLQDTVSRAKNHLLAVNDKRCKLVKLAAPVYDECMENLKTCTSEEEALQLWQETKQQVEILKSQYRKKDAPARPALTGSANPVLTIALERDSRGFGRLPHGEHMSETVKKARAANMATIHKDNAAAGIASPYTTSGKRTAEESPVTTPTLVFKRPKNKAYAPIQNQDPQKPWQLIFYQAFSWYENELKLELGENVVEGLKPIRDYVRQQLGFHVDKYGRLVYGPDGMQASKLTKADTVAGYVAPATDMPTLDAPVVKAPMVIPKPPVRQTTAGQISGAGYEVSEADFAKPDAETDNTPAQGFGGSQAPFFYEEEDDFEDDFVDGADDGDDELEASPGSVTEGGYVGEVADFGMEELS
jgi:hypothetical protein